jgi:hypothetical protein
MRRTSLAACLLALLGAAGPCAAQELGRLFLTPEQRAALDARRKARIPDKPAVVTIVSPTTRIDGYVKRSSGRSTLWVDGEPATEATQLEGLRVTPAPGDPGRVTVTLGESERAFDMKIGQKLDRGSGEVQDLLGEGEIRVRRPNAPAR